MDFRQTVPTCFQGDLTTEFPPVPQRRRTPSNHHRRFWMPSYARPRSTVASSPRQRYRHLRSGPNQVHSNHGTRGHFLGQEVHPNVHPRPDTVDPSTYYPLRRGEPPVNLPVHVALATHVPEIPSQFPVSTGPLIEQPPHQGVSYCMTPSMDAFTGQSNWDWDEAAPPGQLPFQTGGSSQPPSTSVFPMQPVRFVTPEDDRSITTPSRYKIPSNETLFATETCPFLNCHKTYSRRQDLERHILQHLSRCLYCSQPYCKWTGNRRYGLRGHLKQKHGNNPVPDRGNYEIYDAKVLVKQLLNKEITTKQAVNEAHLSFQSKAELLGKLNLWREY